MPGLFVDPLLNYAPFGIQALALEGQTVILVTYAQQNPEAPGEELQGEGHGVVNLFDANGTLPANLVPADRRSMRRGRPSWHRRRSASSRTCS